MLFDQVVSRLSRLAIKKHVALAIGIAGDVINLERIVLGRNVRTELLPICLGQRIKTIPPPRKCARKPPSGGNLRSNHAHCNARHDRGRITMEDRLSRLCPDLGLL